MNPKSYHLVNIVLHSLVTLCLVSLVQPIIRRSWIRWIVSLAFAVHPIHCEAVASLVGRAELGSALHTLVALLAYRAHLKARGRRRYRENKEATKEDRQEEEGDDKGKDECEEERKRIGKKRRRIESLMESTTRTHRNPFENRQSLLSLFIRRVTICCCWSDPLKKIQYRVTSLTSASNNGQRRDRLQRRHHQQDDHQQDGDEFVRNRWRSNDKKETKKKKEGPHNEAERFDGCVYLWASLTAAALAVLWKETGMVAIPLCAIMELTQHFQVASSRREFPSNCQSSDRSNRHLPQVGKNIQSTAIDCVH